MSIFGFNTKHEDENFDETSRFRNFTSKKTQVELEDFCKQARDQNIPLSSRVKYLPEVFELFERSLQGLISPSTLPHYKKIAMHVLYGKEIGKNLSEQYRAKFIDNLEYIHSVKSEVRKLTDLYINGILPSIDDVYIYADSPHREASVNDEGNLLDERYKLLCDVESFSSATTLLGKEFFKRHNELFKLCMIIREDTSYFDYERNFLIKLTFESSASTASIISHMSCDSLQVLNRLSLDLSPSNEENEPVSNFDKEKSVSEYKSLNEEIIEIQSKITEIESDIVNYISALLLTGEEKFLPLQTSIRYLKDYLVHTVSALEKYQKVLNLCDVEIKKADPDNHIYLELFICDFKFRIIRNSIVSIYRNMLRPSLEALQEEQLLTKVTDSSRDDINNAFNEINSLLKKVVVCLEKEDKLLRACTERIAFYKEIFYN